MAMRGGADKVGLFKMSTRNECYSLNFDRFHIRCVEISWNGSLTVVEGA